MYLRTQHSSKSTRFTGAAVALACTAGVAYVMATSMNIVGHRKEVSSELVMLSPPPPPPPPPEKPKPKVVVIKKAPEAPPPPPQLVAPPIEVEVPDPVIVAPPAPPPAPPAPPAPVAAAPAAGLEQSPPKLLASEKPAYPPSSRRAGEQGTTQLEVCVNESGRVTSVSIAGSSGFSRLDQAAADWIKGEKFRPAKVAGQVQSVCGHRVVYQWTLNKA